ncbi:MAG: thiamine diphosphokinase [Chloroflexi bacterium]|nr:thiamine diphosphokinase [Chloroflexota bacterium]
MRAVIFANGSLGDPEHYRGLWRPDDLIVVADGGARNALAAGLTPQVVVGDLDSLPDALRRELETRGCQFMRYPARKDQTDLELALREAARRGAQELLILAATEGRTDQSLANILLLARSEFAGLKVKLVGETWEALLVRDRAQIIGQVGDTLSLIPLSPRVTGIYTGGLEYPLEGGTLEFGSTRGISNVFTASLAEVRIGSGALLAVRLAPGALKGK